jgi:hypothetical protein
MAFFGGGARARSAWGDLTFTSKGLKMKFSIETKPCSTGLQENIEKDLSLFELLANPSTSL